MQIIKNLFIALLAGTALSSCNQATEQHAPAAAHAQITTPDGALAEMKDGNKRFLDGKMINTNYKQEVEDTKADQHPHTMVLSCMDSRVPPEIVFDQGIGNIFVARVAGNVEDSNMLGSMEYATQVKGTKLIVVMGHAHCGAVKGSIDHVKLGNLTQLLDQITPAITGDTTNKEKMLEESIKNNVKQTMQDIVAKSEIIAGLVKQGKLKIVGAYYDLATGQVTFME